MTDRTVCWMKRESLVLPWSVWQTVCLLENLPAVVNSCLIDNSSVARFMEICRHGHLLSISSCESLGFKNKQKILISVIRYEALWGKSDEGQRPYLKEYTFGGITSVKKTQSKYPSKRFTKMTRQPNKRLECPLPLNYPWTGSAEKNGSPNNSSVIEKTPFWNRGPTGKNPQVLEPHCPAAICLLKWKTWNSHYQALLCQ